ncbi:G-type lectin S-receptor-like serine/threonine-protein kinase At4g27290 isoform X3 [Trifolium pratense]|uniref:G-type lectin S-receptor-like serine/threonine-protein kinase At4g27290 isoform X3 n=1 Tax=Trifolium pratense TaxID=57577 RepID=UPI001E693BA0|nr:G-type lectin S-receptor-like serine/threonine-protein kinase At4g27290 isoform X3 [Trifolium pratense]
MQTYKVLMLMLHTFFFCIIPTSSIQYETFSAITPDHSIQGNETLVSSSGTFEAGFFNFANSQLQYFGIWYKTISPKVYVWIANRDSPIQNSTPILKLTYKGTLTIVDDSRTIIWSSNASTVAAKPVLLLLDSGNLVVKDGERILWESFDYPGDTFLAGMKLKTSLLNGPYMSLTSWKSVDDPSLDHGRNRRSFNKMKLAGALVGVILFIMILGLATLTYINRKKLAKPGMLKTLYMKHKRDEEDVQLSTIFGFSTISNATNHFSDHNKLGQGGFGPVYKGILEDGLEIAVKRLSEISAQGEEQFKNEVMLMAKLQHRNLVKLLGCSIFQDEKLLIYELMPNRSLNYFIFDSTRKKQLDLIKRFQIIDGIARGLLYLHQDSRLRIIHRDLKTSNILLDNDMNPRISDFGLARTFLGDQDESNTKRLMGTYGYMPPEYAVRGCFSIKSDVFSFGVIVLEIISGRRIRNFYDPCHHHLNLLGHAWRLWGEEKAQELIDESFHGTVIPCEILRCIHIGLLCVQQRPEHRSNMSSVVLMLNGEKLLPEPNQPGFYTATAHHPIQVDSSQNEASLSLLEAR